MSLQVTTVLFIALTFFIPFSSSTRAVHVLHAKPLATRLQVKADGGIVECWNALAELRSCSDEIVLFFINGETDIGSGCCGAIKTITRHCWPAILTSLGFTAEEGNILIGYCDASASGPSPAAAPAPLSTAAPVQPVTLA